MKAYKVFNKKLDGFDIGETYCVKFDEKFLAYTNIKTLLDYNLPYKIDNMCCCELEVEGEIFENKFSDTIKCNKFTIIRELPIIEIVKLNGKPIIIKNDELKFNFINDNGNNVLKKWADAVNYEWNEGYGVAAYKGKGWFYTDKNGDFIPLNIYLQRAFIFMNGFAIIKNRYDKYNFIDINGNILSKKLWFDYARSFKEGYALVKITDKGFNFININGAFLSDKWLNCDYIDSFSEGYFYVCNYNNGKKEHNFISEKGISLFKNSICYDYVHVAIHNGYILIENNGKYNFLDKNEELLSKIWFDEARSFSNGYAEVLLNNKKYFLDTKGQLCDIYTCIPLIEKPKIKAYKIALKNKDNKDSYSEMLFKTGKTYFINECKELEYNRKGFEVYCSIQALYSSRNIFDIEETCYIEVEAGGNIEHDKKNSSLYSDIITIIGEVSVDEIVKSINKPLYVRNKNQKKNIINLDGKLLSPILWFDDIWNFNDGWARVKYDNKYNFININNELLSKNLWFDSAYDFNEGYARVYCNKKWNFIDKNNNFLFDNIDYTIEDDMHEGCFIIHIKGKGYTFINIDDKLAFNGLFFDYLWRFENGYAFVCIKNKGCNLVNKKGYFVFKEWLQYKDGIDSITINIEKEWHNNECFKNECLKLK